MAWGEANSDDGRRPKVMFVCYGGGHAALLAPVAAELIRRGGVEVRVLALTTAGPTFQARNIPYQGFADYVDPASDADVIRLGERLYADVNGDRVGVPRPESIAYMGLSMSDLIAAVGEKEAWERYRREGRHAFLPVAVLRKIISLEKPDIVVATNSPKSERAAILAANQLGIETLIVPDLFATRESSYVPFEAKWYAAMCDATSDDLQKVHGIRAERIRVTGQPAFDKQSAPSYDHARSYVADLLGIVQNVPYFLVVTSTDVALAAQAQPTSVHSMKSLGLLVSLACEFPRHRFVIKPHPTEPQSLYEDLVIGCENMVLAPAGSNLDSLIVGSAGVIAASLTTAAIDALCLDRNVLLIDHSRSSSFSRIGAVNADIDRYLIPQMRSFIGSVSAKRFAGARFAIDNRGAARKITALIMEIVDSERIGRSSPDIARAQMLGNAG